MTDKPSKFVKKGTKEERRQAIEDLRKAMEEEGYDYAAIIKRLNQYRAMSDLLEDVEPLEPILPQVRMWVQATSGRFSIEQVYAAFPEYCKTGESKRYISKCLHKLIQAGILERATGTRHGYFQRIENELQPMDFLHAVGKPVKLWLPFGLDKMVKIYPSNIIIIAGQKSAGKTTISLNIAWQNRHDWDVNYFNSEMASEELRAKLELFEDIELMDWAENVTFWPRSNRFHQVVKTGTDKLNIIDYMHVSGDNFPYVGQWILEVHEKVINTGAITIICLQKPPGRDLGYGGTGTLDIPRLYLAAQKGRIKIVDCKAWNGDNPNEKECNFKIVQGNVLLQDSEWGRTDRWNKEGTW